MALRVTIQETLEFKESHSLYLAFTSRMPQSTIHASDLESHNSDDDTATRSPHQGSHCSHSFQDRSGSDGDDESDEERDEVVFIPQDQGLWSIEELEILSPFKDEWVESTLSEQGAIIEHVVKDILALRKQDP